MCNELTHLAQQGDWRYIAQCEHQTVHLRWDHLTLSLPPTAFLQLGAQIIKACEGTMFPTSVAADVTPLTTATDDASSPTAKQPLRLRVNTVTLEIPAAELADLVALLQRARAQLHQAPSRAKSTGTMAGLGHPRLPLPWTQSNRFPLTQHLN